MSPPVVSACPACSWEGYPERVWCPSCGCERLTARPVATGVVEAATTLVRAAGRAVEEDVRVGVVALDGGARAIARIVEAEPGDRVTLAFESGRLVGRGGG